MRTPRYIPFVLFVFAAAYFAAGATLSLEWTDEGQVVYPSWLVSQGAVPYRDFHHLYGPSLFYLNGLLFHAFGADLIVLRISVVLVKAVAAVLVYLTAIRLAAPPFALAVSLLLVTMWGGPWWVFNMPYANHYAITLALAGFLCFVQWRRRFWVACVTAGVLFGLAATFKQTTGIFACMAFALSLLVDGADVGGSDGSSEARGGGALLTRVARAAVPVGALALVILYLSPRNTAWNIAMIAGPFAVLAVTLLVSEFRTSNTAGGAGRGLAGMAWCGFGMAIPIACYAAFYASQGLLWNLVFDLVHGLPGQFRWFTPFQFPRWRTVLWVIGVGASLKGFRDWGRTSLPRWRLPALLGGLCLIVAAIDEGGRIAAAGGAAAYLGGAKWYAPVFLVLLLVPTMIVAASFPAFRSEDRRQEAPFFCFAATSLLFLYPAADFWHALMILPAILPLLAARMEGFCRGGDAGDSRGAWPLLAGGLLTVLVCALAAPFVHALAVARYSREAAPQTFERARGIVSDQEHFAEVLKLVERIDTMVPTGRPLLVLTGEQMLYFLSGRRSALERAEFLLYMVAAGIIEDSAARELLPGAEIVRNLDVTHPIIVDRPESGPVKHFRRVFPEAAEYISTHCLPQAEAGGYEMLDCGS